ncbi:hypothetical protein SDC9_82442 [bioreactor metagenome]|uniref:Uncharacterized protein n=1 Tax=bioreactor metagenome TaxID=1076179 RepID=A0A644Z6D2_9ZZZZ
MLHLYFHPEFRSKIFNQLPEIHSFIGDVVKNRFTPIALILNVSYFHIQAKAFGHLSGSDHGGLFFGFRQFILFHIRRTHYPVNPLWTTVAIFAIIIFAHLHLNQLPGKCYSSDIVSGRSLNGNNISFFQFNVVAVYVISFPGIFKLNFHHIGQFLHLGEVVLPIVNMKFGGVFGTSLATTVVSHGRCFFGDNVR